MTASAVVQGPVTPIKGIAAAGGGTFVANIDFTTAAFLPYNDRIVRVRFEVVLSQLSAGHLLNCASYLCEAVVSIKNGTCAFVTAIATSSNPINSNTVGFFLTGDIQCADTAFNGATAILTVTGSPAVLKCTVTNNNGGGIAADVTVTPFITVMGSV